MTYDMTGDYEFAKTQSSFEDLMARAPTPVQAWLNLKGQNSTCIEETRWQGHGLQALLKEPKAKPQALN